MKHLILKSLLLSVAAGAALTVEAQNCQVSSLPINTGFDPVTNSLIPQGGQDPHWRVTSLTPSLTPFQPIAYGAVVVVGNPSWPGPWPVSTTSGWISFNTFAAYSTQGPGPYTMVLSRTFSTCTDDSFSFNFTQYSFDQRIDVSLDGNPIYSDNNAGQFTSFTSQSFNSFLTAGTHTLDIQVRNDAGNFSEDGHGLNITGNITSLSNATSLVGEGAGCENYVCGSGECTDSCYWKVYGNTIIGGNNRFGTLSDDDIRIQTAATFRGIMTKGGLLGWNTMTPTAYLHVQCDGHNRPDGKVSDVRFENLEPGTGTVLVINREGYVLDSRMNLKAMQQSVEEQKQENMQLKAALELLKAKVDLLLKAMPENTESTQGHILYQNIPNPFKGETSIPYYVATVKSNAYIVISDIKGSEWKRFPIAQSGHGKVTLHTAPLSAGIYLFSLIVDGHTIDTKKMVFEK